MSRVKKPGNKYMNSTHYDQSVYNTSKMVRIHAEGEDYHKATTLSHWLFVKYDMSYKSFKRKSKAKKDELREEFEKDTYWARNMFTAEQLGRLTLEELEKIMRETPVPNTPTLKELESMNVGIYDENGKLIGDKEGDDY